MSDKEMAPQVLEHLGTRSTDLKEDTVDNTSLAHPTRTIFVDNQLLEEIAELTGIEYRALSRAFTGERRNVALDVVKTAVAENPKDTSEDWQQFVLAWAKENGSGQYRPGFWDGYELTYEYNEFLRSIGWL